jgi:3-deoxy-manno-octulosonate cytidylyltransferase (CMP-KDO synthetase)
MSRPVFKVVIPARYASTRLPAKPLLDLGGKPMVVRVAERARLSGAEEIWVATDHAEVRAAAEAHEIAALMTRTDHATGTDRLAEVVEQRGWSADTIIVNVQGDEPLLPPALIDQVARLLAADRAAGMATLMTMLADPAEYLDPNMAKVVASRDGAAIYFSRAPIPASREGGVPPDARRHIGLYAYRVACLKSIAAAPMAPPERAEKLEQLRALWLGQRIAIADALEAPARGVDTAADLEYIRGIIAVRERQQGR